MREQCGLQGSPLPCVRRSSTHPAAMWSRRGCVLCTQAVWNAYVLSMRQAGFTAAVPMYAASGLLTYGASEDMDHIIATLQAAGLCSEVLYKELYIPQAELDGVPGCLCHPMLLLTCYSCDILLCFVLLFLYCCVTSCTG